MFHTNFYHKMHHLRLSYNAFIRLLDLNFNDLFHCTVCGPDADVIVMDGIMMGCREELVREYDEVSAPLEYIIEECSISDWVMISNTTSRKRLAVLFSQSRNI